MATYGLRIKHPSTGAILLELTSRITRKVALQSTGSAAGSITVPASIGGSVWFAPITFPAIGVWDGVSPRITLSGRTISWTANANATFAYGVY